MLAIERVPVWAIPAAVVVTLIVGGAMLFIHRRGEKESVKLRHQDALYSRELSTRTAIAEIFESLFVMMDRISIVNAQVWNSTPPNQPSFSIERVDKHMREDINPEFQGSIKGLKWHLFLDSGDFTLMYFNQQLQEWHERKFDLTQECSALDIDNLRDLIEAKKASDKQATA
jgi:hypothetical protein